VPGRRYFSGPLLALPLALLLWVVIALVLIGVYIFLVD
jgi:hypothetical protein